MSDPLVSVLICCYNRRDFLALTLDSVFAQDYPNIEVVVVDDGSEDGTEEMIRERFGERVALRTGRKTRASPLPATGLLRRRAAS